MENIPLHGFIHFKNIQTVVGLSEPSTHELGESPGWKSRGGCQGRRLGRWRGTEEERGYLAEVLGEGNRIVNKNARSKVPGSLENFCLEEELFKLQLYF